MKFALIEPFETRTSIVEAGSSQELYARAGFGTNVDHGIVAPPHALPSGVGISIVVDGFGLFKPADQQRYFAIGRQLYGGNAVLYGFDDAGETVDLREVPVVVFMTASGVEDAIGRGQIDRPICAVNDEEFWRWPQQPPPFGVAS